MKFEFPPPEAPPISGSDDVVAAGGYAAWNHSERWGQLPHVEDWRGYGGDPSDTGAIQAGVNQAEGALRFAAATYTLEDTITITRYNVFLIGQGEGGHQRTAVEARASAATRLIATTAQPMILFTPVEGGYPGRGGGIRRMMLDGDSIATKCLEIRSWRGLRVDDMHLYAATEDMLFTGAFAGTLVTNAVYVVMYCYFNNVQAHAKQAGGTAYPVRLTGGQGSAGTLGGNTCYCTFINCMFLANEQDGMLLEDTDSNTFIGVQGGADGPGDFYGLVLGSADQDSSGGVLGVPACARYNSFFSGTYGHKGVFARAGQTGGFSSFKNSFYGKITSNAEPMPIIEAGAGGSPDGSVIVYSNDGIEMSANNVIAYSGGRTLTPLDSVLIVNGATNRAIVLPKANQFGAGKTQMVFIGRSDTGTPSSIVTVSGQGTDTVNGLATIQIGAGPGIFLYSDGVGAWFTAGSPMMRHGLLEQATEGGITLTPWLSPYHLKYSATQTALRTVTLSTTGAMRGMSFKITRTGGGAFNLNVGTGPLKALATNQWCEVAYDGTAWYLSAFGSL